MELVAVAPPVRVGAAQALRELHAIVGSLAYALTALTLDGYRRDLLPTIEAYQAAIGRARSTPERHAAHALSGLRALVASDAYALTAASLGNYRQALLSTIDDYLLHHHPCTL